jgi:hypothetical protein
MGLVALQLLSLVVLTGMLILHVSRIPYASLRNRLTPLEVGRGNENNTRSHTVQSYLDHHIRADH